jgi:uncharacterized protein
VIALDTNLLVYAHRAESEHNEQSFALLADLVAAGRPMALPWPCVAEFVCVVTHPRYLQDPTPLDVALHQVDIWLAAPNAALLAETPSSWPTLRDLLDDAVATGPRVYDARIAAICLDHGVRELWTADRDYSPFPALRTRNPLVDP